MPLSIVESPTKPDQNTAIALKALAKTFALVSLERQGGEQFEPDFWALRFCDAAGNWLGNSSFRGSSPLVGYALELHSSMTFVVSKQDMPEFRELCERNEVAFVLITS